jgi:hypothetical protein
VVAVPKFEFGLAISTRASASGVTTAVCAAPGVGETGVLVGVFVGVLVGVFVGVFVGSGV